MSYQNLQSPLYQTSEARNNRINELLRQLFNTRDNEFKFPGFSQWSNEEALTDEDEEDIAVAFDGILDKHYSGQELRIKINLRNYSSTLEYENKISHIKNLIQNAIKKLPKQEAISSANNNNNQIINTHNSNRAITTNQHRELPLIFDYRPQFHEPNDSSLVQQLSLMYTEIDVFHEVNEVVWLRAIQRLTAEEVGLPVQAHALLAKFKATMILQAHELFYEREKWHRKFTVLLSAIFKDIRLEIIGCAISNPQGITQAEEKITQVLTIFSTLFLPIDTGISKIENIVRKMLTNLKRGRFIEDSIGALMAKWEAHIQGVFSQLSRDLYVEIFKISVTQQSKAFDFNEISKLIEEKKQFSINADQPYLSPNQAQQAMLLRDEYFSFYDRFLASCDNTVKHAQRLAPDFTNEQYSQCYQQAFNTLRKYPLRYLDDFLLEMALQQQRKSQHSNLLYNQLEEIFLPAANHYYKMYQQPEKSFADISIALRSLPFLPVSLEELIASAYAILHTPLNSLNGALANQASILIGWVDNNNTNALAIIPNNTRALVSTLEQSEPPLFDANSPPIPGAITHTQVIILAHHFDHISKYSPLFANFCTLPNLINDTDTEDRNNAVALFYTTLASTQNIEEIMALLSVVKKYINRHRNPFTDLMRDKENTEIWKACFKAARLRALSFLPTAAPTEMQLSSYRSQFIFSEHREEALLFGAWGNTSAQREIDRRIASLKN